MRRHRHKLDLLAASKALLVFAALVGLFIPIYLEYAAAQRRSSQLKLDFAAVQIASRVDTMVGSRVRILKVLEDDYDDATPAEFAALTRRVLDEFGGFLAINRVDTSGVIRWVSPGAVNQPALGRDLSKHPAVAALLDESRVQRAPKISPIIQLIQGPLGFAAYIPIVDDKDRFEGWINGVFALDLFLRDLIRSAAFRDIYVRVSFAGNDVFGYEHGTPSAGNGAIEGRYEQPLYNQQLQVVVRHLSPTRLGIAGMAWWRLLGAGLVLVSALVSVVSYFLLVSAKELRRRLEKERLQSNLLNLLVHDILNPLLIIRYSTEAARKIAPPEIEEHLAKTHYGVAQLDDVITRVKDMRALELGRLRLDVTAVPINDIIDDTLKIFEPRFVEKGITPEAKPAPSDPAVLVDRVIFQNNVINNIVSNAVKFSEPGGVIAIEAAVRHGVVDLRIADQGIGMAPEIRRNLFMDKVDVSQPGTRGELGTGIGMLQVKSYTRFFSGDVFVTSRTKKEDPVNHGTCFTLTLPLADGDEA